MNAGSLSISSNANLGDEASGASLNLNGGKLITTADLGLFNVTAGTNNRTIVLGATGGNVAPVTGTTLTHDARTSSPSLLF